MEDPIAEISTAIDLRAGSNSADAQVTAFYGYFTPDAGFLHPLCFVPSRTDSRKRVIGIFLFYRGVVLETWFEIQAIAFDERNGRLLVDLLQSPYIRFVSYLFWGWRPVVTILIDFHLRKMKWKWYIDAKEDVVQPMVSIS
jgi:hypothetical protein